MYKLTIITVCYNEYNIIQTCESIISQTWQDFEWIFIDGGSNLTTLKKLENYKKRMNVFISEKDNGIYDAMNKGIKLAHGEYCLFLNGGDYFYNKFVLEICFNLKKISADVAAGHIVYSDKLSFHRDLLAPQEVSSLEIFRNKTIPHQGAFIRSCLFQKYGLYNDNDLVASDWEKWFDFFSHPDVTYECLNMKIAYCNANGISEIGLRCLEEEREKTFNFFLREFITLVSVQRKDFIFLKIQRQKYTDQFVVTIFNFKICINYSGK